MKGNAMSILLQSACSSISSTTAITNRLSITLRAHHYHLFQLSPGFRARRCGVSLLIIPLTTTPYHNSVLEIIVRELLLCLDLLTG
jgi:hypothetical protein